jgi:hypothetical protein
MEEQDMQLQGLMNSPCGTKGCSSYKKYLIQDAFDNARQ